MRIKLLTCLIAGILCTIFTHAQTLFSYGPMSVSQAEFTRAFEKNPDPGSPRKALENYLPLYINYKLKVQDALDKKMDTLPNQVSELENYRGQLTESFINKKANINQLVKEAFEYSQKDIFLGHLFISFNPSDSASIAAAAAQADKAKAALAAKEDFSLVVSHYSNDQTVKATKGNAGWITAFSIPYPFEKAVFNLPVGGYTDIFKGSSGFHIFKNMAERPAVGKVKIAQILLVNTEPGNKVSKDNHKQLADSLYAALLNGASFEALALEFSNDRSSRDQSGVLPEFGVGTYDLLFEQYAFSLKNKGDITKPFKTGYGWHILKLIEKTPVPDNLEEADINNSLTEKVMGSERAKDARNTFLHSLLPKLAFKAGNYDKKQLWLFTDSSLAKGKVTGQNITGKTVLFAFGDAPVNTSEWLDYVKSAQLPAGNKHNQYTELLKEFTLLKELNYLRNNLQLIEPDFNQQLKEFKDANLLFEVMDNHVWNKATVDVEGLKAYYNRYKAKYLWGTSANAVLITSSDPAITSKIIELVQQDPTTWKELSNKYSETIIADSGRYELSQLPVNNAPIEPGMVTQPVKNELDNSETFACILSLLPADEQRSFEDARGFVINDYQQILEEKWLTELKKKYPVKLNQPVWNKLLRTYK